MKKLLLLSTLVFSATILLAQTSQGFLFVGGGGSFGIQNQKQEFGASAFEDSYLSLSLTPTFGVFLADGILVGGMVDFGWEKLTDKVDNQNYSTNSSWTIGPFGRYYHSSDYFAHAAINFGKSKFESVFGGSPSSTSEQNILGFEIGVGKAIFFNEFVALEPMVLFESVKSTDAVDNTFSSTVSGPIIRLALSIFID